MDQCTICVAEAVHPALFEMQITKSPRHLRILVPVWRKADFWPLLKNMQVLKEYPRGSKIFSTVVNGAERRMAAPWAVRIYHNPPKNNKLATLHWEDLAMLFPTDVARRAATVLLDSGANDRVLDRHANIKAVVPQFRASLESTVGLILR